MKAVKIPILLSLGLLTVLSVGSVGCGNKDAADSVAAPPVTAPGAATNTAGMPPEMAAKAEEQNRAAEAHKRMNAEIARGRQAAEQAGNK